MGQHQAPSTSIASDRRRLQGRQMLEPCGQLRFGLEKRRLAHQQVDPRRELFGGLASSGVHHERHRLAPPRCRHLLDTHRATVGLELPVPHEMTDVGAGDTEAGERIGKQAHTIGLVDPETERCHPVVELAGADGDRAQVEHDPVDVDRDRYGLTRVVEHARCPQPIEVLLAIGGVCDREWPERRRCRRRC